MLDNFIQLVLGTISLGKLLFAILSAAVGYPLHFIL